MEINDLDGRLRAVEKKFKDFEAYLRSPRFRIGRILIVALVLLLGAAALIEAGYDTLVASRERPQRIDAALASNIPSYGSAYCRWVYDKQTDYDACLAQEQQGYSQFDEAWHRDRTAGIMKDLMMRCFSAAQNEYGMSWKQAADCADLGRNAPKAR